MAWPAGLGHPCGDSRRCRQRGGRVINGYQVVGVSKAWSGQYGAVESGLADWFACSYLNNPNVGEVAIKAYGDRRRPYVRTLRNERKFGEFKGVRDREMPFVGAEIWDGACWAIRARLGREIADPIVVAAWQATMWSDDEGRSAPAFIDALCYPPPRQNDCQSQMSK